MNEPSKVDHPAWPARAALLAAGGAGFGLAFDALLDAPGSWMGNVGPFRAAAAIFLAVSGIAFALSLERRRWLWSAGFAAAGGLLAAFVAWWIGAPAHWGAGERWQLFSAVLAVAIALPLFQSCRDTGRPRPDVAIVHANAWTNLILAGAAGAFVGATLLVTVLLAQLFHLIGIDFLRDRLNDGWFMWPLACGAFGGAAGLLRDRDPVLGTLHKVGRAVLSVLAPLLALGLALFVLALPFTGLRPLWDQTQATTPILLACIVGALILANAVIGNESDEEARSPALRVAAIALGGVMAPLALVAAVSTAKRIGQYGLTPDRLWACVFVLAASAFALAYLDALVRGRARWPEALRRANVGQYGLTPDRLWACVFVLAASAFALAYLHALVRGRARWPEALRRANVGLAAALSLLALLLALPLVSFGAISTRDQLARLESGRVSPERFDWAAMRFDFGPSGRSALARLRDHGSTPEIRSLALAALGADRPSAVADGSDEAVQRRSLAAIRIVPTPVPLPVDLRLRLAGEPHCGELGLCLLIYRPGEDSAALVAPSSCVGEAGATVARRAGEPCRPQVTLFRARRGRWARVEPEPMWGPDAVDPSPAEVARRTEQARADLEAIRANRVDIRKVERRQVFVDGRPAGEPFE